MSELFADLPCTTQFTEIGLSRYYLLVNKNKFAKRTMTNPTNRSKFTDNSRHTLIPSGTFIPCFEGHKLRFSAYKCLMSLPYLYLLRYVEVTKVYYCTFSRSINPVFKNIFSHSICIVNLKAHFIRQLNNFDTRPLILHLL